MSTEFEQGVARTQAENTIKASLRRMYRIGRVCLGVAAASVGAQAAVKWGSLESKALLATDAASVAAPFAVRRRTLRGINQVIVQYGRQVGHSRSPYIEDSVIQVTGSAQAEDQVLPWQRPTPPPGKISKYYPLIMQTLGAELAGTSVAFSQTETTPQLAYALSLAAAGLAGGILFESASLHYEGFENQLNNVEGAVPPQVPLDLGQGS